MLLLPPLLRPPTYLYRLTLSERAYEPPSSTKCANVLSLIDFGYFSRGTSLSTPRVPSANVVGHTNITRGRQELQLTLSCRIRAVVIESLMANTRCMICLIAVAVLRHRKTMAGNACVVLTFPLFTLLHLDAIQVFIRDRTNTGSHPSVAVFGVRLASFRVSLPCLHRATRRSVA